VKAKRSISIPLSLNLSFFTRLKLFFGWRLFVVFETQYGVYEPKAIAASSKVAVIPPWSKVARAASETV